MLEEDLLKELVRRVCKLAKGGKLRLGRIEAKTRRPSSVVVRLDGTLVYVNHYFPEGYSTGKILECLKILRTAMVLDDIAGV